MLQLSLQQLAVGLFALGLLGYAVQHLLLCLRQVLVLGFLHLLPQCGVGLSVHEYWYHEAYKS